MLIYTFGLYIYYLESILYAISILQDWFLIRWIRFYSASQFDSVDFESASNELNVLHIYEQ